MNIEVSILEKVQNSNSKDSISAENRGSKSPSDHDCDQ